MLGIVVVVLIGVESLIAQEGVERPEARPRQQTSAEQLRRQRAAEGVGRERIGDMQPRRQQRADREAVRSRMGDVRDKPQQFRPEQERPVQQMFDRWFNELTKAYQENDRQKMGQLIRKMHQLRQRQRKARPALGERVRDFRVRPGAEKGHPDTDKRRRPGVRKEDSGQIRGGPQGYGFQPRGMDRPDRRKPPEGRGGWGRGFQGRGMGGCCPCCPGAGMRGWGPRGF